MNSPEKKRSGLVEELRALPSRLLKGVERKRLDKKLARSEKQLRDIFDHTAVGMYRTAPDGRILMANPALVRMLGYASFDELARRNLEKEGYEPDYPRSVFREQIEKEGKVIGLESAWTRQDGTRLVVIENARAVRDEHGSTLYYEGTAENITERKKAEEEVLDYQAKLKSLASELLLTEERERRRIATGVHDQIGQQLALLKLELQLLGATVSDAGVCSSLDKACELMDQIIGDSRSLTFELSNPVLYEVGLDKAVESWLDRYVPRESKLKYKVISKPSPLKPDVETSVVLFGIIRELLTNVVKHGDANTVQVHIQESSRTVQVSIEDDGVGFESSKLDSPIRKTGGFGLFNARERVEYLGGRFEIESKPGQGTCVRISVPAKREVSC